MKDIKWTEVLVAEDNGHSYWVRAYHSEDNAPSFEEVRQEWLDEGLTHPHMEIMKAKISSARDVYCLTMENYSETFHTLDEAHNAMLHWLRLHSEEFQTTKQGMNREALDHDALHALAYSYNLWSEANGLKCLCMDEQLCEDLTEEQRQTVTKYIHIWEALS